MGDIVEGDDAPAEGEEEVGAEGDKDPEGQLQEKVSMRFGFGEE